MVPDERNEIIIFDNKYLGKLIYWYLDSSNYEEWEQEQFYHDHSNSEHYFFDNPFEFFDDYRDDDYANSGGGYTIDNTRQAWNHYMNGNGAPVSLGPNTVNALLNHTAFQYRHNRIVSGLTTASKGFFAVNMTGSVFHVGRTNVNYSINCASGNCNVTYELFVNDGFWDVDYVDEKVLGDWFGIDKFKPDGLGPNLERFGGTPYPYIPTIRIFAFPNPGYNW